MANKLIEMNKIKEIIRLRGYKKGKTFISEHTGVARNTVKKYIQRFQQLKLTVQDINEMSDQQISELFGKPPLVKEPSKRFGDLWAFLPYADKALRRRGVTREKLWKEYLGKHPDGYRYTRFCLYYIQWQNKVVPLMHMIHKAGDKLFIDFAGEKLQIVDTQTGEIQEVEVFIAILGSSQLTYAEACMSQTKEDFISCCENALHYYEGVPQAIVPDNLRSAVTKSDRYEPTINEAFADFADHYQCYVVPARPYHPRDKALVEGAVKILYTRIYSNMPKQPHESLIALNEIIREHLEHHNNTKMQGRNYSRREQFEEIERKILLPLPVLRYEFKRHSTLTVMKNAHVCLSEDKHYYSVPFKYIGRKVKILYSKKTVEICYKYERITIHERIRSPYNYTTIAEHLPSTHRFVSEWSAEKFMAWAESIDPSVKLFIEGILDKKQHPEQAYKSCIGVLSFVKKVGKERLVNACKRGLDYGHFNYGIIRNILEKGYDKYDELPEESTQLQMPMHENIRGEEYYE
jgi:transposase